MTRWKNTILPGEPITQELLDRSFANLVNSIPYGQKRRNCKESAEAEQENKKESGSNPSVRKKEGE